MKTKRTQASWMLPQTSGYFTSDNIDYNAVWTGEIVVVLEMYNKREKLDYRTMFCSDADERLKTTRIPGTGRMERMGEVSQASVKQIRRGKWQEVSEEFGGSFGFTRNFLARASTQQIIDRQADALQEDRDTMRYHIIRSVVFNKGAAAGCIWNGFYETNEGISAPPPMNANVFTANHNHFVTTGTSTFTSLPIITTIAAHIREHNYSGRLAGIINIAQQKELIDYMNIAGGATTLVPNPITNIIGASGIDFVGRVNGVDWMIDSNIPAGYGTVAAVDAPGSNTLCKFVQLTNAGWQGLLLRQGPDPQWPIVGAQYERWFAAKVWNRSLAVAFQFKASGSYDNPPFYTGVE